jgi:hypothetical protein
MVFYFPISICTSTDITNLESGIYRLNYAVEEALVTFSNMK